MNRANHIQIAVGIVLLSTLSACASVHTTMPALEAELTPLIREGMPSAAAITALNARGFSCKRETLRRDQTVEVNCSRSASSTWPPFTCIHRVLYQPSAADTVTQLRVLDPACAGL